MCATVTWRLDAHGGSEKPGPLANVSQTEYFPRWCSETLKVCWDI